MPPGGLEAPPLLRGTCAIDDGAFAVRGVPAVVGFEDAKYSGFPGSVVPATDPIPAGSDYLRCDLTGGFYAHPYAFNFTDVQGASALSLLRACCALPRAAPESDYLPSALTAVPPARHPARLAGDV